MSVTPNRSIRRARRRAGSAAAAAAVALIPLAASCEVTTTVPFSCSIIGVIEPTIRSNASPDSVAPGGTVVNEIDVTLPAITTDVPVNQIKVNYPLPDQLASVSGVTFTGGNMTGSYAVSGDTLVLTFAVGGISTTILDLPLITATGVVDTAAAPGTMTWAAPSQILIDVNFLGTPVAETCTVNPGTPAINNTNIVAAAG